MALTENHAPDRAAPWAVLTLFLVLMLAATEYVFESSQLADRARFEQSVQAAVDQINARIDAHVNVLRAATGLFAATQDVTRDQFRAYIRHLQLEQRNPGMQGIGLSLRVRLQDVELVIADLRANDFREFRIWPWSERPEYHTIVVLEPLDRRNRAAIGYDMFTHPLRRAAMERARDTGEPAATAVLTLVQEIDGRKQPGFLVYVPIYSSDEVPATVAERRQALYGFVYAPFRAADLINAIFQSRPSGVMLTVRDGRDVLFASHSASGHDQARYAAMRKIRVGGREWTIDFAAPRTQTRVSGLTIATAGGGLLISVLLFALLRVQLHARGEAERVAETLRRSEAELQKASRAKDEFLATLSHELRTPMTAILGWSKLMADDLGEETRNIAVDAIQKSSKAQAQLIDDLLDVSRITAGKMRIEVRAIDLAPIIRGAVDAVAPAAEAKGVTVGMTIPPSPLLVSGDANRLQQVIWNLLSNAVKFTPRGGQVDIRAATRDPEALLTVTDTGQGIEPAFLPYVFDRFRQADSSMTRAYTGLGLGLAIVRHLIELHGGSVEAFSEGIGKGARFTVRLPRIHVSAPDDTGGGENRAATSVLRGAKVLVVDDEDDVRSYAGAVFRMSGSEVRCVRSADEALELLSRWVPDVLVSDLGMPEKDGFELLRAIRASAQEIAEIPVIALTAYARPEDRERAEREGFEEFVAKPVDPAQLRTAVARVLTAVRR